MVNFEISPLAVKLFGISNELDRFDFLTDVALAADKFPPELKTDEHRLRSCETKTWYSLDFDGAVRLNIESDSLFVKGLCLVLADVVKNASPGEIKSGIGFAEKCFDEKIITDDRRKGLSSLENEIIKFANKISTGGTK